MFAILFLLLHIFCHSFGNERIITDLKAFFNGVSVDYSYNQTKIDLNSTEEFISAPGCPKSDAGYPWVYYGTEESIKCVLAGHQGPCKSEQKIFIERGSPFGYCNCKCFAGEENDRDGNIQFCWSRRESKDVAYFPKLNKCFGMFDQGPCKDNEWLVKIESQNGTSSTKCEERKCPEAQVLQEDYTGNESSYCRENFPHYGTQMPGLRTPPGSKCDYVDMEYSEIFKYCLGKFDSVFG